METIRSWSLPSGTQAVAELLDPAVQHLVLARRGGRPPSRRRGRGRAGSAPASSRTAARARDRRPGPARAARRAPPPAAAAPGRPGRRRRARRASGRARRGRPSRVARGSPSSSSRSICLALQHQRLRPQGHQRRLHLQHRVGDPRLRHVGELARAHHLDGGAEHGVLDRRPGQHAGGDDAGVLLDDLQQLRHRAAAVLPAAQGEAVLAAPLDPPPLAVAEEEERARPPLRAHLEGVAARLDRRVARGQLLLQRGRAARPAGAARGAPPS